MRHVIGRVKAHDFKVIVLRESEKVTTPLCLFWSHNAVAANSTNAVRKFADDCLVT